MLFLFLCSTLGAQLTANYYTFLVCNSILQIKGHAIFHWETPWRRLLGQCVASSISLQFICSSDLGCLPDFFSCWPASPRPYHARRLHPRDVIVLHKLTHLENLFPLHRSGQHQEKDIVVGKNAYFGEMYYRRGYSAETFWGYWSLFSFSPLHWGDSSAKKRRVGAFWWRIWKESKNVTINHWWSILKFWHVQVHFCCNWRWRRWNHMLAIIESVTKCFQWLQTLKYAQFIGITRVLYYSKLIIWYIVWSYFYKQYRSLIYEWITIRMTLNSETKLA